MFRRVGNYLVNLRNVGYIELYSKCIEYNMLGKRFTFVVSTGGTDDIKIRERFKSEEEAAKAYFEICKQLTEMK